MIPERAVHIGEHFGGAIIAAVAGLAGIELIIERGETERGERIARGGEEVVLHMAEGERDGIGKERFRAEGVLSLQNAAALRGEVRRDLRRAEIRLTQNADALHGVIGHEKRGGNRDRGTEKGRVVLLILARLIGEDERVRRGVIGEENVEDHLHSVVAGRALKPLIGINAVLEGAVCLQVVLQIIEAGSAVFLPERKCADRKQQA